MIDGTPRILIIRLSAVGDVVRTLPALHVLRDAYPEARIDWAVEPKAADIVRGHPGLDRVLAFRRGEGGIKGFQAFRAFCRQVRDGHYDIVFDFHGILKSGIVAWFSRAGRRFGFAPPRAKELSWLLSNRRVKLPALPVNRVEENLLLCEALVPRPELVEAVIHVPPGVQEEVNDFFETALDGGKLVVAMHVPVDRPEKQWPIEHFATLGDSLIADGRFEVLLTWGPGQFGAVEEVAGRMRRKPILAPAMPGLKHYAWLVYRSDLYFGCDTGPMHIAWAMGTPVVAVFGATDPTRHAPYHRPHVVLQSEVVAAHGQREIAPDEWVSPEAAYDACVGLIAERGK